MSPPKGSWERWLWVMEDPAAAPPDYVPNLEPHPVVITEPADLCIWDLFDEGGLGLVGLMACGEKWTLTLDVLFLYVEDGYRWMGQEEDAYEVDSQELDYPFTVMRMMPPPFRVPESEPGE